LIFDVDIGFFTTEVCRRLSFGKTYFILAALTGVVTLRQISNILRSNQLQIVLKNLGIEVIRDNNGIFL
jgi:hypothetical protein